MGRFREAASDEGAEAAVDIAPLIDCVFILLIFFIVTTTFVEESGVEVDKPQGAAPARLDKPGILIALTEKGQVFHEGDEIGFGGVQPLVRRMLQQEPVPVVIQAEAAAPTGLLIRLVDETKLAGAAKVSVATSRAKR
jgi:biopolymer transport protein ExbD